MTLLFHIVMYSTTKCIGKKQKNGGDLVQFIQFDCTEADINASFQSIVRKIQGLDAWNVWRSLAYVTRENWNIKFWHFNKKLQGENMCMD